MMSDSFVFYRSFSDGLDALEKLGLSAEEQLKAYKAIVAYGLNGEEPDNLSPAAELALSFVRPQLDANRKRRDNGQAGADHGKKGGRPKQENPIGVNDENDENPIGVNDENDENPIGVNDETPNVNVNVNVNANVNENENVNVNANVNKEREVKAKRFSPPSLSEVKEYCSERQNNVDPNRFIDFYSAKGWKVGNQPMKDWKAAVRTWENRDNGYSKTDRPPNKKTGGIYAASMSGYGYVTADGEIVNG